MKRSDFLKYCAMTGLVLPLAPGLLTSCSKEDLYADFEVNFSGKVLIIGAGSAGLMAGHVLNYYNIDFEIIEASSVYGGRIKGTDTFADFKIDLGAEWIHADPSILSRILNDPDSDATVDVIRYAPPTLKVWDGTDLLNRSSLTNFYGEYKFKSSGWFDFFEQHIVPAISSNITFNSPVNSIDYSGSEVVVTDIHGTSYTGDKVIVTVPLTQLKNNSISFTPELSSDKTNALDGVEMPDGIKVFMEFQEKFYPDLLAFDSIGALINDSDSERLYYNAAFGKGTSKNILGLFTVGKEATQYSSIATDEALIAYILAELDEIFEGAASSNYIKHITQNWSKETYIGGSYSHYSDMGAQSNLASSVNDKLFFSGEAYAESYATVHGASERSYVVVQEVLSKA